MANLTIITNTLLNQQVVSVTTIVTPTTDDMVCFKEGTAFYQGEIINVVSLGGDNYNITLDSPLDYPFSINGGCSLRNSNMAVDGSVTPVVFAVSPIGLIDPQDDSLGQRWDITRMLCKIIDNNAMDTKKFGGQTALTKGIIFRKKDGVYKNIFNVKTNGDFALHAYDKEFETKAPSGSYEFSVRKTFTKSGVTIRLNANDSDLFQGIVQDDATGNENMECVLHGHVVTD